MNKFYTKVLGRSYYYVISVPAKIDLTFYYPMQVTCANCGFSEKIYFRKGKYVKDITPAIHCRNCKCHLKDCACNVCN